MTTPDPGRPAAAPGGTPSDRTAPIQTGPPPAHRDTIHGDTTHRDTVAEQKARFGGIKWGSAFFGWLTATGSTLILTALAAALGASFGLAATPGGAEQAGQAVQDPQTAQTAGIVAAVVVLVILLLAYFAGGYVAGRMARFDGAKQGLAVWLWAVIVAVVVALLSAVAGSQFNILAELDGLPRIPVGEGALTTAGIITAVVALAAALVGAVLGGLAGMRFHRKVDRATIHGPATTGPHDGATRGDRPGGA